MTLAQKITVGQFIERLQQCQQDATIRFSMANDSTDDPGERWFAENGVESVIEELDEVTICLVGISNNEDGYK